VTKQGGKVHVGRKRPRELKEQELPAGARASAEGMGVMGVGKGDEEKNFS